ncbi:HlyD family type I secretion periplasmic adaptor subunit [Aliiroseovarius crassostreae]|uniref:HlyD family type I secretion periplasmic adaptor subunit n=1 Tax=Aliiroseovarius crassostreae TaxID=154981 RepID=UPI0021B020BC|nr:HlyD family type I secretion periplasmic adaptor subunit [Aliiroseovarius crassostreae]UWQ05756.1 HlyD family type I secretion periplasmic adaptor subunit [Aliiroseovarius crassostreae]
MPPPDQTHKWSATWPTVIGMLAVLTLFGGMGSWAVGTQIAGAVVTTGTVQVVTDRQVVQHPDGGVVGQILAQDGDVVQTGDVLLRFDDTFLRSELEIVDRQLLEIFARRTRLEAERDGQEVLDLQPPDGFAHLDPDWIASQLDGQTNLFTARLTSLRQETDQLNEQIGQIDIQISGLTAQLAALNEELELVNAELVDQTALLAKQLVSVKRVNELKKSRARLGGEIGQLEAQSGEAQAQISTIRIEILKLGNQRREAAIGRLRDLRYSEIELVERQLSLRERLSRMEVRAPADGVIFGSSVRTEKAVIRPADPMMFIVPRDRPVHVSARVDPVHIDEVHSGQVASLHFSSFDQRKTPEISGTVQRISPDTMLDEHSGLTYYEAIVTPDDMSAPGLDKLEILPGMPVEVFLKTEDRTPLSYLLKPLTDYFRRAFRES